MAGILIIYSTTDGHTRKICQRLQQQLESDGGEASLVAIEDVRTIDLATFDKIVLGASIRYGKHSPLVHDFVRANAAILDSKPSAFFSVNIVARKAQKNRPETNPYLQKFLGQVRWRPKLVEVFAGKLDYPRYKFFDRVVIRFIMLITKGPTDPASVVEFTDWRRVEAFAQRVARM